MQHQTFSNPDENQSFVTCNDTFFTCNTSFRTSHKELSRYARWKRERFQAYLRS